MIKTFFTYVCLSLIIFTTIIFTPILLTILLVGIITVVIYGLLVLLCVLFSPDLYDSLTALNKSESTKELITERNFEKPFRENS